ncbi:Fe-S cluster assembly ABC transporter permease/ATPase [Oleiphilus messinensis]|uniref:Fe-S cluster assembly ABC transporter permease/ATPase n=1 Tax=Oleiphilus messinensis TaxID=141451 RepID=A0A1Y0I775_9GAMM|nr:ABC transporter ATP-binding protein/permease [Oleiphilus messinensis]ARU56357.1 Fe-S cluster assembly ABC transporter permease/ATPase [Oleiphilus messinensis]
MRRSKYETDDRPVEFSVQTLRALVPYLLEFKGRVALALSCLILAKLASVGLPFLLKYTVDALDAPTENAILIVPMGLLLAYGAVRLSTVLFGEIRDTLFGRVTERAMRRIGLRVFRHIHALELDFHLNRRTGELSRDIERGVAGISFIMRFMVFNIVPTLLEIGLVISLLLINYDLWFAVITLVAITLYGIFSVLATEWRTGHIRAANKADSASNARAIDSMLNYETVKYFSNEEYEARQYDENLAAWEAAKRKNRLSLFALNGGQALIVATAMTSMMILAAYFVTEGTMTLGDFVLINAFMMQLFLPLNFLGFVYREMKGSLANIERMFNLLQAQPKVLDVPNAPELKVTRGEVKFDNVEFFYHPERPILERLTFAIKPLQKVAVVGHSGAGKSTLIKLLFRFYDVTGGAIKIDGQSIQGVSQQSLRKSIGIVPQDPVLFNASLLENVRYGRIDASDEDVDRAIQHAHLDDLISRLPEGKHTLVGERGLKLSGGEKQRVAIARTILKAPPILVFDEATSALDSHSEQKVLEAIKSLSATQTTLVIAHRLSTIVDADMIVVLENGAVVETGTHHQLLDRGGEYARLWKIQQQRQSR